MKCDDISETLPHKKTYSLVLKPLIYYLYIN